MANTRYIAVRPLEPGKPVDVFERDELGALVGAWHGYWNFKRGTVALYPNPKNRFISWPGGVLPQKRIVSDRVVSVQNAEGRVQKDTSSVAQSAPPSPAGEGNYIVQETIKFN